MDPSTRLARIRRIAWLVDGAFRLPGTRFRFGLNSLIGLAPVAGDAVLGLVSLYIIQQAHELGLPPRRLVRMVGNVALEVVGGSVPILGNVFDMALKANILNIRIIEDHLRTHPIPSAGIRKAKASNPFLKNRTEKLLRRL